MSIFENEGVLSGFEVSEDERAPTVSKIDYDTMRANMADIAFGVDPDTNNNRLLYERGLSELKRKQAAIQRAQTRSSTINEFGAEAVTSGDEDEILSMLLVDAANDPSLFESTALEEGVASTLQNSMSADSVESAYAENDDLNTDVIHNHLITSQIIEEYVVRPLQAEAALRYTPSETSRTAGIANLVVDTASYLLPFYQEVASGNLGGDAWRNERQELFFRINNADDRVAEAKAVAEEFRKRGIFSGNPQLALLSANRLAEGISDFESGIETVSPGLDAVFALGGGAITLSRAFRVAGARKAAATQTVDDIIEGGDNVSGDVIEESLPSFLTRDNDALGIPNTSGTVQKALKDIDDKLSELFTGVPVERLNPEQRAAARKLTRTSVEKQTGANDFADVRIVREKETQIERMTFFIGEPNDSTRGFPTRQAAAHTAKDIYKLRGGEYKIIDGNGSFFITVDRLVSETAPSVLKLGARDLNDIKTSNPLTRFLTGGDNFMDVPSRDAAHMAIDNYVRYRRILTESISNIKKSIGNPLKSKSRKDVKLLLERSSREEKWYTPEQMKNILGRDVTDAEIIAYNGFRKINDLDYYLRNADLFMQKTRAGYERVGFRVGGNKGVSIEGKIHETPPFGASNYRIFHADRNEIIDIDGHEKLTKLYEQGYRLVQPFSYDEVIESIGSPVQFVLTKRPKRKPLPFFTLGYKKGGHRLYTGSFFIKQGRELDGIPVKPRTYHVFESVKEAEHYTKRLNIAREAAVAAKRGDISEFEATQIISSNTYIQTYDDFVETVGDITKPFEVVRDGERLPSYTTKDIRYFGDEDELSSIVDWYYDTGRAFTGKRGKTLRDPQGLVAPVLDPIETAQRALGNSLRIKTFTNYRIKQVDDWYATFKNYIEVPNYPANSPLPPSIAFRKGVWKDDTPNDIRRKGDAFRRNVNDLIGVPTKAGEFLRNSAERFGESIDRAGGKTVSKFVYDNKSKDVSAALRSFAFDLKLGMFDISQLLLQPQAMTVALGIDPVNGVRAFGSYMPIRMALINGNPDFVNTVASWKILHGFEKEEFIDLFEAIQMSGRTDIGGNLAYIDNLDQSFELGIFGNAVSRAREAGRIPFNEGEKINRIMASAMAYRRLRKKFPDTPMRELLPQFVRESDMLSANMTTASNAIWQRGVLSIPTQFASYQARILELMFGRQLSAREKLGVFVSQSAFYGAAGIPAAGYVTNRIAEFAGADVDAGAWLDNYYRGLYDSVIFPFLGFSDTAFRERAGIAGGENLITSLYDESVLEFLAGASGNIVYDIGTDIGNHLHYVRLQHAPVQATGDGIYEVLRQNIASLSRAHKAVIAFKYGQALSSDGTVIVDGLEKQDAILQLLGVPLQDVVQFYNNASFLSDEKQTWREASKMIASLQAKMYKAIQDDREEDAEFYAKQVHAYMTLWRNDPQAYQAISRGAVPELISLSDKLNLDIQLRRINNNASTSGDTSEPVSEAESEQQQ